MFVCSMRVVIRTLKSEAPLATPRSTRVTTFGVQCVSHAAVLQSATHLAPSLAAASPMSMTAAIPVKQWNMAQHSVLTHGTGQPTGAVADRAPSGSGSLLPNRASARLETCQSKDGAIVHAGHRPTKISRAAPLEVAVLGGGSVGTSSVGITFAVSMVRPRAPVWVAFTWMASVDGALESPAKASMRVTLPLVPPVTLMR